MVRIRLNIASIIGIINALILAYAAWVKRSPSNCYFCHQTTYLPISDLTMAYLGIAMSLSLAALAYIAKNKQKDLAPGSGTFRSQCCDIFLPDFSSDNFETNLLFMYRG